MEYDENTTGYQIEITEEGKEFLNNLVNNLNYNIDTDKLEKVLSLIENQPTRKMELLGSVLYFAKLTEKESEIEKLMNMIKPHFKDTEIKEALERLKVEHIV